MKREELLIILLQAQPELAGLFFDYGIPEKTNMEEFMNRNFKFNVSVERFAFMTGRSLSAFKQDFKDIFNDTPKATFSDGQQHTRFHKTCRSYSRSIELHPRATRHRAIIPSTSNMNKYEYMIPGIEGKEERDHLEVGAQKWSIADLSRFMLNYFIIPLFSF